MSEEQERSFNIFSRKTNNKYRSLKEVVAGVPQRFIDRPLSFNLLRNDLFLFLHFSTLSNYRDDNNLLITGTFVKLINQMLLSDFRPIIIGFMKTS